VFSFPRTMVTKETKRKRKRDDHNQTENKKPKIPKTVMPHPARIIQTVMPYPARIIQEIAFPNVDVSSIALLILNLSLPNDTDLLEIATKLCKKTTFRKAKVALLDHAARHHFLLMKNHKRVFLEEFDDILDFKLAVSWIYSPVQCGIRKRYPQSYAGHTSCMWNASKSHAQDGILETLYAYLERISKFNNVKTEKIVTKALRAVFNIRWKAMADEEKANSTKANLKIHPGATLISFLKVLQRSVLDNDQPELPEPLDQLAYNISTLQKS
jgi:hypothetical protein